MSAAEPGASQLTGAYHAFEDPMHDTLMGVVLALGAEVWVLDNRMALLETALERRGIEVGPLIDELAQDPQIVATENARRDAFLARFLRVLDDR
jgi:uncharacterized ferritin-like protein (DUF455 family)